MELRIACQSCYLRSYKPGGALRCLAWKRHTMITRCSDYIGPHPECHFKLANGPDYAETLARHRNKNDAKIQQPKDAVTRRHDDAEMKQNAMF